MPATILNPLTNSFVEEMQRQLHEADRQIKQLEQLREGIFDRIDEALGKTVEPCESIKLTEKEIATIVVALGEIPHEKMREYAEACELEIVDNHAKLYNKLSNFLG